MNYYKVFQIDSQTWRIEDCFKCHIYLLEGEEKAILVDTGMGMPGLADCVKRLTQKPVIVINSHGHLDHVGANCQFQNCYMMEADKEVMKEHTDKSFRKEMIADFAVEFGFQLSEGELDEMAGATRRGPFTPIADRQIFRLGGRTAEVIATPGHTGGSICLLDRERKNLFSGDTICDRGILLHFPHSASVSEYRNSVKKLQKRQEEYDTIWPGHHDCPLDLKYLEEYEKCAAQILENPEGGETVTSKLGNGRIQGFGRISISYRPDNL